MVSVWARATLLPPLSDCPTPAPLDPKPPPIHLSPSPKHLPSSPKLSPLPPKSTFPVITSPRANVSPTGGERPISSAVPKGSTPISNLPSANLSWSQFLRGMNCPSSESSPFFQRICSNPTGRRVGFLFKDHS
ncbi:hypothetical protein Cni_G09677 [Canna indica]|uniref:Uncharacterized protein n=1 Tax=Canna indica TaxID=4628 RepID=A0AAQ3K4G4_9LILI|nr:hypothetical protein Cni_G09677 [Canna indica]